MTQEEWFDLVNEQGEVIGRATRRECHGNPALLHPVAHVLVVDAAQGFLLQKRAATKDIQPGKWDMSVGGHRQPGEGPEQAARREMQEELGVTPGDLHPCHTYIWTSPVESEFVSTFITAHPGPFPFQAEEIDAVRFWSREAIESSLGKDIFTPNFEHEWRLLNAGGALNFL